MNELLHVHSRQSGFDSEVEFDELMKWCKENGATAVAITDHGTVTGIPPFVTVCKDNGIKPIVGVEAYVKKLISNGVTSSVSEDDEKESDGSIYKKSHLILMAMDAKPGYTAISKAVTLSNKQIDSKGAPLMDVEILRSQFGPGTPGHGHVIATTACMQGYVNAVLNSPFFLKKDADKIQAKMDKIANPSDPEYETVVSKLEDVLATIDELRAKKTSLDKLAKRAFGKREKAVKAAEGTPEYAELKAALDADKEESAKAAIEKKEVDNQIAKL